MSLVFTGLSERDDFEVVSLLTSIEISPTITWYSGGNESAWCVHLVHSNEGTKFFFISPTWRVDIYYMHLVDMQ